MFHHFHDDTNYPNLKDSGSISASDLNLIIDYIDENFNLISSDEFTDKVVSQRLKDSDVCLTFDDSLKCQFDIAYPILENRKLKAFFFVYSGAFSKNPPLLESFRDFRLGFFENVDEYYKLFFETIRKNYSKDYNFYLKQYKSDYLSNFPFYTADDKKYRFIRDIVLKERYFNVVKSMMREVNYSITDHLSKLFMSIENLKDLHRSGHIIGLHSDTHPTQIHNLSYGDQLNEYMKSYEFISSLIDEKPTSMSHPCGNYNDDTIKILKKLGINIGFRSSMNPSSMKSSLEIPREDHANIIKGLRKK